MTYNEKCPICGKENTNMIFEETGGWFECQKCHNLVNNLKYNIEQIKVPIYKMADIGKILKA